MIFDLSSHVKLLSVINSLTFLDVLNFLINKTNLTINYALLYSTFINETHIHFVYYAAYVWTNENIKQKMIIFKSGVGASRWEFCKRSNSQLGLFCYQRFSKGCFSNITTFTVKDRISLCIMNHTSRTCWTESGTACEKNQPFLVLDVQ